MNKNYSAVLFDLDGTINDSGPGIIKAVTIALDAMGVKDVDADTLRKFVGPSLMYSFTAFFSFTEAEADEAIRIYRENYNGGLLYDLTIYDGIKELLGDLKRSGKKVILVTSKPHVMALKILEHFDLDKYFDFTTGSDLTDHSSKKVRLINQAIEECNLDKDDIVMIGDTHYDIDGACEAGIDSIGVTYGYGTKEELQEAGATYMADSVKDIREIIF